VSTEYYVTGFLLIRYRTLQGVGDRYIL